MIAVPKIVLIVLLMFVVWYAVRWFNRPAPKAMRRGAPRWARSAAGHQAAVEDLVACRACGAYVAPSARGCGKAGCPRPA
jgi:uncharacterized membrane-anchored protein